MALQVADTYVANQRVRDLGASEYLVYLIHKHAGTTHLVRAIEFDGPVDPALMERAFRQMVDRRLILRARIPPTAEGEWPYYVLDDSTPPSFVVKPRQGPNHWAELFNEELNQRCGVDGDPPIRAQLLMSDEPGGELLLTCSHAFCDGRSLVRFCMQLLDEYEALVRGEDGDPSILPSGISPEVGSLLPFTPEEGKQLVADYLERAAKLPIPKAWPFEWGDKDSPRQTKMFPLDLTVDEVSAMRANARDNGTTVLGALGAAMILATGDVIQPSPEDHIVVTSTLDIRDRLRVPVAVDDMGIYAATINSRHFDLHKQSDWDHARDFKNQVTAGIERNDHYTFVFIGGEFVKQVTAPSGDPMFTDTLASLGAMELRTEGTSLRPRTLRGALGLHHAAFAYTSINGIGINGAMAMTFVYPSPWVSEERAHEFTQAITDRMRWYASNAK